MSNQQHAAVGNVQGFELPRGCLFTSIVILSVIVACGAILSLLFG